MRLSIASSALAAVFSLTPLAAGYAPALGQDFSITNQVEPANPGRRDLMRQLQAWWDTHGYYPRHASNSDEAGTVDVHLVVHPDGRIWTIDLEQSPGSHSLDAAGEAVFRGGVVRPFAVGEPEAEIDISLHYVLAHRHDQPVAAGYAPVLTKGPFTITNEPVKSPILDTMVQKTCTGTITLGGIPNEPLFGVHSWAQAIFFRKPDGTPWVKFSERGHQTLAPVTEVGRMVMWAGRQEHQNRNVDSWLQYTVWPAGDNHLSGAIGGRVVDVFGVAHTANVAGNSVDLTCSTEALPTVTWTDWVAESSAISPVNHTFARPPPVDPP